MLLLNSQKLWNYTNFKNNNQFKYKVCIIFVLQGSWSSVYFLLSVEQINDNITL